MSADPRPPFPEYFDAEDLGDKWHLWCKRCGKGWALWKAVRHHGNLLHLLNHARGHGKPKAVRP